VLLPNQPLQPIARKRALRLNGVVRFRKMGPFTGGWTEADVEAVLARGIPDELLYIPIVVGMSADCVEREWAENMCLTLVDHAHKQTRCNALTGLGHIARVCGELSLDKVLPAVSRALSDEDSEIKSYAENAAFDIQHYLGVAIPGYAEHLAEGQYERFREAYETLMQRDKGRNET
jgi:hypothetical protein